jgi:Flp pilus assembly protein TadD
MQILNLLILGCLLILTGCASQESKNPHVLSGEAPVEDVVTKADESFRAADFQAAVILYQIAIGQDPQADYWFKLGLANAGLKQQTKAIYSYVQAVSLDPLHTGALEKLGLHYTAKGEIPEARNYLRDLLDVEPDNWKAHNALGVLADLEEEFTDARNHYVEALKLRPDLALLWNNMGYSVYLLGDLENAEVYMRRALELDPDHHAAKLNLALVHVRQAEYAEALAVLARDDDLATAYTNLGYLSFRIGEFEKAEGFLLEAISQSPTYNQSAHSYLAAARQASEVD